MKKQILITGGGTGIGRALAERFARKDWQVTIVGRRSDLLEEGPSRFAIEKVLQDFGGIRAQVGLHKCMKGC